MRLSRNLHPIRGKFSYLVEGLASLELTRSLPEAFPEAFPETSPTKVLVMGGLLIYTDCMLSGLTMMEKYK